MTLLSALILASTWGFLWSKLCLFWPFALLGIFCGLGAAWWIWYRQPRVLSLRAEREMVHLRGSVKALESAKPLFESREQVRAEVELLKGQVEAHRTETERAKVTIADRETEYAKLSGTLAKVKESEQLHADQLVALKANVETLTSTLRSKEREALSLKTNVERDEASIRGLKEKLANAGAKEAEQETALKLGEKEIARLKERLIGSEKLVEEQKQRRRAAESSRNSVITELEANGRHLSELQSGLAKQQKQLAATELAKSKHAEKATDLENKLAGKERVIAELQKSLVENEAALTVLETERDKVRIDLESKWAGKFDALHGDFSSQQSELNQLRTVARRKDDDLEGLRGELRAKDADLAKQEAELAEYAKLCDTQRGQAAEFERQLAALREREESAEAALELRDARVRDLSESLAQGESAREVLMARLDTQASSDAELEGLLAQRDQRINDLEKELEKSRKGLDQLKDEWEHERRRRELRRQLAEHAMPEISTSSGRALGFASFEGENVQVDKDLGVVYCDRPEEIDDLKEISGVAAVLEKKLHTQGVYRFKQLALWDESQVEAFSTRLSFEDRIQREQWQQQAAALHLKKYGEQLQLHLHEPAEAGNRWESLSKSLFADGDPVIADQHLGVRYTEKPGIVDELTRIGGVAEVSESKLHEHGVYRFKQIALWDKLQIEAFSERLSFCDRIEREEWVRQAANLHFEEHGEDLAPYVVGVSDREEHRAAEEPRSDDLAVGESEEGRVDALLGMVYQQRPRKVDDLTRISGVAKVLEAKLHSIGVYRFKQIAEWGPDQVSAFSEKLSFKGRIEREGWLSQAASLHEAEYGEKLGR